MRMFFGMMKNKAGFSEDELRELLDSKALQFNSKAFIETDPISIPHLFTDEEDIAIAGFLTATIAWGQRVTLIRNAHWLVERMDMAPAEFVRNATQRDLLPFKTFVHRTFNGSDCLYFLRALQGILLEFGSLEAAFKSPENDVFHGIQAFRSRFLKLQVSGHHVRHVADPAANSAAKRINMFLRWMVRKDNRGVDFGLWKVFEPSQLICPLDVHSGGVARKLGLLERKQDDWKAAIELTNNLSYFDAQDPVKYDFALFGLGAFDGFRKDN